jgi:hypothetical protein
LNLTKKDVHQIEEYGISIDAINKQLDTFIHGIAPVNIITAASVGNGIEIISADNQQMLVDLYEERRNHLDLVKFVPASGAATRMFSFLHQFLDDFNPKEETLRSYLKTGNHNQLTIFLNSFKEFAFVNAIRKEIRKAYPEYKHSTKGNRVYQSVSLMLGDNGLNFNNLPKGLIPFHKYSKYSTTAFEEQLYEAAFYASSGDKAFLHFTFSETHLAFFKKEFEDVKKRVSKKTKTNFNISYSFQKKKTDTIAVSQENKPFRDGKGELIFRPSGHGALLENLNEVDADVIFIKNIDNVVVEELVEEIVFYKKVLAGKLIRLQSKIFNYIRLFLKEEYNEETIKEVKSFLWNELNIKNIPESIDGMIALLNRPTRVCGVVKNTGAPGGGPFWVKNVIGNSSLQIVEMAQIDIHDPRQQSIVNEATHFNPVDIVCGVRDYNGEKFDLTDFTDPDSGFISIKSQEGKSIKALELPGLWNGAMANWNTALVEVPLCTFNPVKTINDLLSNEHRSKI